MSDSVNVNSVKASEVSREMVALYLLASVAQNEDHAVVNIRDGVPVIGGVDKKWLLENYSDCVRTVFNRQPVGVQAR